MKGRQWFGQNRSEKVKICINVMDIIIYLQKNLTSIHTVIKYNAVVGRGSWWAHAKVFP